MSARNQSQKAPSKQTAKQFARRAGCARKRGVEALLGRVADELAKHDGIGSSGEAAEAVRRLLCAECKGTGKTHRNYMWIAGGGREVECGRCYGTAIAHNAARERQPTEDAR